MYDGMRHFLFILPPIFVMAGFAFEYVFDLIKNEMDQHPAGHYCPGSRDYWDCPHCILMNILTIIRFIGGTAGAFRHYETDYWLTCYKEAVEQFDQIGDPTRQTLCPSRSRGRAALCG